MLVAHRTRGLRLLANALGAVHAEQIVAAGDQSCLNLALETDDAVAFRAGLPARQTAQ